MARPQKFGIDLTKKFRHLRNAPIVEAVIEIRARAEGPWEESAVVQELKGKLTSDYPKVLSQTNLRGEFTIHLDQAAAGSSATDLQWRGCRFQSADDRHIAQFNRDGFVFSRLPPYESWDRFYSEAMRLWRLHKEVARPTEAQRIGLRFINRIELPLGQLRFEDYIQPAPRPPKGMSLPFLTFFQRDTLLANTYALNVTRATQRGRAGESSGIAVILDIDVVHPSVTDLQEAVLEKVISEMRWLKNKAFFGSITLKALKRFGEIRK